MELKINYPFQNPSLSIDERIADLIGRLTLEEKVSLKMHDSPAIDRLNIPRYNWWNEALHGHARAGKATVFPQAIGMAATFDENLLYRISSAISDEARAFYHAAVARNNRLRYGGLTFWTPNINIFRDPRWGRGQETYGEDPFLTSSLGVAFVKGLQGDDPNYLKTAACAKHYVVHSGPEELRHEFNARASKKDMWETYLPAFKALVQEAKVEAVMCAYNRTNDEACCGSKTLIKNLLRDSWGFEGHVVSDCWALKDLHEGHKITGNEAESAALALKSGVNLNCGSIYNPFLADAVNQELVSEQEVDESLAILLKTRFKLGLFDPPGSNPYEKIGTEVIHSELHRGIALEAARKSLVLLKNDKNVLPLDKNTPYVYVVGPNANNVEVLLGNYYGLSNRMTTILEGIVGKVPPGCYIQYKQGFMLDRNNINPIDWSTGEAKEADVSIVVMGIAPMLEGEEGESIASPTKGDRLNLGLPENQLAYLRLLREENPKPIIAIITGGSPVDLTEVHELADAILFVWYPGEEGGNAVADVLYGDVSPSGRLPVTFPKSEDQLPPFEDYSMQGRTYRFMTTEPQYPFGFGLGYVTMVYSNLSLSKDTILHNESTIVSVTIENKGEMIADEVVQMYISAGKGPTTRPLYQLMGFQRVNLKPGNAKRIEFTVNSSMLTVVDEEGNELILPGQYTIWVGGASPVKRNKELGAELPMRTKITLI